MEYYQQNASSNITEESLLGFGENDVLAAPTSNQNGFISDATADLVEVVIDMYINTFLSVVGLVGNVLQIVVFCQMGFQETINISLTFIAGWDLMRCVCNILARLRVVIKLFSPAMATSWFHIQIFTVSYISGIAGYESTALAGYVALERCICVSMPLTVRYLLTPKVVIVTNILISIIVFASFVIWFFTFEFFTVFSPIFNETIVAWKFSSLWIENPEIDYYLSSLYIGWMLLSLVVISASTIVMTLRLRSRSKFINKSTLNSNYEISPRNRQVMKMLLLIISIYIINNTPRALFFMARLAVDGFDPMEKYRNLLWVSLNIINIFDFINAGCNPIIIYFMSSQFKQAFKETIICKGKLSRTEPALK